MDWYTIGYKSVKQTKRNNINSMKTFKKGLILLIATMFMATGAYAQKK